MKKVLICLTCKGKKQLWLGGKDYLECPDCLATGKIEMNEYKVRKTERSVFIPGLPVLRQLTNRLVNVR